MAPGHLYILLNANFPRNLLKVGMTTKSPEARARELSSSTGVPTPFVVAYSAEVSDCRKAESLLHQKLDRHRTSANREFFELPLKTAIQELDAIALQFVLELEANREIWPCQVGGETVHLEHLDDSRRRFRLSRGGVSVGTCAWVERPDGGEILGLPVDALTDEELDELELCVLNWLDDLPLVDLA